MLLRRVLSLTFGHASRNLELFTHRSGIQLESLQRLQKVATSTAATPDTSAGKTSEAADAQSSDESSSTQSSGKAAGGDLDAVQLKEALEASQAKYEDLKAEMEAMRSKSTQVMADMENLRKRTSQQVSEAHQFALQGFCKNILDVADNLERALDSVPASVLEASQQGGDAIARCSDASESDSGAVTCDTVAKNLTSLHNGVAMSNKIMHKIFKDNGLEKVESVVGGPFDPNLHNAMFEVPTPEMEEGSIAAIMKQGYILNGRVIRAADVGVAKPLDG